MDKEILDYEEALGRVLNKRELYIKLLNKFIDNESNTPTKIREAYQNNNIDEAKTLVHTTKGVAANLGAKLLQQVALELENDLKTNTNIESSLQNFIVALNKTIEKIKNYINQ